MAPDRSELPTIGHYRGHGVTRLLVYCCSMDCNHSSTIDASAFPDDLVALDLDLRMRCNGLRPSRR
jgi:hypothetical protein